MVTCDNTTMFLRSYQRKKNGKRHRYYSVVENRRVANGRVIQKTVLYLGEITCDQEKAWRKTLEVFDVDQNKPVYKRLFAADQTVCPEHVDTIGVRLSQLRLSKPRAFGDCWLGCQLWASLHLDAFWQKRVDRDRFMKRLGVLRHAAGRCSKCVDLQLPAEGAKVRAETFQYQFNRQAYRRMIHRDGKYFLRTNQTGKAPLELWEQYMLQTRIEQAVKELKSDLCVRPIHHQLEARVAAPIFVAFMGSCLQTRLRQKLKTSAPGMPSQAVLAVFSKIQMLDVHIPTQANRMLHLQRYTEPEQEHKILLETLNLRLPAQPPPKIYHHNTTAEQTPP